MQEYDFMQQLMQVGQQAQPGMGVLAPPGMLPANGQSAEFQVKTKQPIPPPPPELAGPILAAFAPRQKFPTSADEFNQLIKRQSEGMANQREGLKDIESQISELNKPGNDSILPGVLMAASDLVSGTKFMQGYKSPAEKEADKNLIKNMLKGDDYMLEQVCEWVAYSGPAYLIEQLKKYKKS
jgi:hypothetical protein